MSENANVADYDVSNNGWNMPMAVLIDLILITNNMPPYQLSSEREDCTEWVLTSTKDYTVSSAWSAIRPVVQWYKIVWNKDCIPRCSFIFRSVCRNRLNTRTD